MPKNFLKVNDKLYRGGKPSGNDLSILKNKYGVQRIVSLDLESGNNIAPFCKQLNLEHFIIPLENGNSENLPKLSKNLDKIFNSGKKSYVHCYHGRDRTGMVCAIYRIHSGWSLEKALKEAYDIGMGLPLDPVSRKTFYDAVIRYAQGDSNHASDIVSIQRKNLIMDDLTMGIEDPSISSPNQMSFAPYSGFPDTSSISMNSMASSRIYTFSKSSSLLNPNKVWYSREDLLKNLNNLTNEYLFSAEISSEAKINNIDKRYDKAHIQSSLINGFDVVYFKDGIIIVLNPNALIDIKEEAIGDSNYVVDVGLYSNYDGMSQYVAPGSGGVMDMGYGGFGGYVQMPKSNF